MDLLPLLLLLVLLVLRMVEATCYFPDGETIPRQDTPCHSEGESTCCGAGYACLSNNLCMLTEHVANVASEQSTYVRGSCTDRDWRSPNCPNFCVTPSDGDYRGGGMGLNKCAVTQDRYYCINSRTYPLPTSQLCSSSTYFVEFAGKLFEPHLVTIRLTMKVRLPQSPLSAFPPLHQV